MGRRAANRRSLAGASGMGGRENFAAGVHELSFDLAILKPIERAAGDEKEIMPGGHKFLILTKNFAEAAFGASAFHGVADGGAGGDHAETGIGRRIFRRGNRWRGEHRLANARCHYAGRGFGCGAAGIPKHKGAAIMAAPVGPDMLEIQLAPQTLLGAEAHVGEEIATPEGGRSLDDGQPFTAFATAVCEDRTATFGGFTGKETDLAGAFYAVRAKGGHHGLLSG